MIQSSRKAIDFIKGVARNAPWAMIAIVIHVIVIAILSVVYIAHELAKDDSKSTTITVSGPKENLPPPVQPPEEIDRKLVPKTTEAEVVSFEEETFEVSEPQEDQDLYLDRGDPTATDDTPPGATGGTSFGVGNAPGHFGTGMPSGYATRRVGGGGNRGRSGGRMVGTEAAVLEGLRWLVRHQNPDGSWGIDTLRERCNPKSPCVPAEVHVSANFNEGLTGLALLAFLGAGFTHDSKEFVVDTAMGKKHYFGEVIKKGLTWLKTRQNDDGSFGQGRIFMYNEALATMAMTEAFGLSQNKFFREPAERGVQFLIEAQKISPADDGPWGWRYESKAHLDAAKAKGEVDDTSYFIEKSESDISVTGWVVMALKSAAISGFDVPPEVMQGALEYAKFVATDGGLSGYVTRDEAGKKIEGVNDHYDYHTGTMSALNMLVRTFVAHDLEDPYLELAAQHIVKDLPTISKNKLSIDYYYWYYASMALNQFDGPDSPRNAVQDKQKYWGPWKKDMESALLELQDKNRDKDACSRGGWLVDDRWSHAGHALYNTAINTLTLEVYYRYENAFGAVKRGTGGPEAVKDDK